jgi:hypothetical protein
MALLLLEKYMHVNNKKEINMEYQNIKEKGQVKFIVQPIESFENILDRLEDESDLHATREAMPSAVSLEPCALSLEPHAPSPMPCAVPVRLAPCAVRRAP